MSEEQEKIIENAIFDMIDSAQGRLRIAFYNQGEVYKSHYYPEQRTCSFAESDPSTAWVVCLRLFEGDGFDLWMAAIERAKILLVSNKESLRHDCKIPNQYRRLIAKTRFKETYNSDYKDANT